jgi:hypothetical protein
MIAIMTTVWRRPTTTRIVLRHNGNLRHTVPVAVVSPEDPDYAENRRTCELNGWIIVESENLPLGRKANVGLAACEELRVSGVLLVGSDDLITQDVVDYAIGQMVEGVSSVTSAQVCVLDWDSWQCIRLRNVSTGVGRFLSRTLLEELGWRSWPDEIHRSLDVHQSEFLRGRGVPISEYPDAVSSTILDIKSGKSNIWSFGHLLSWDGTREYIDPEELLQSSYPSVASELIRPPWQRVVFRRLKLRLMELRSEAKRIF